MSKEIVNRVAESVLETFDLEEHYPEGPRAFLDIAPWLDQGIVLREKDFRVAVAEHDWSAYREVSVAVGCTTDAIVPTWAFLLVVSRLEGIASRAVIGDLELLETVLYEERLATLDYTPYADKPVILKGCSAKPVPPQAYARALAHLQAHARSVQFGEACSSVPLYKRPR